MRRLPALLASALMLAAGLTGCTPRPNSAEPTAAAFLDAISSRQFGELASLVDDHFGITPSPETPLADAGLSSLDRVELAIRIEERFSVRIDESVYEACATAGDLANYIEERAQ